jgi:hypothetical protein
VALRATCVCGKHAKTAPIPYIPCVGMRPAYSSDGGLRKVGSSARHAHGDNNDGGKGEPEDTEALWTCKLMLS